MAVVLLEYDGTGSDQELISALDKKYDALKDKLLLEALKKQLGNATFTLGNTDWNGFLSRRSGEVGKNPSAPNRSQKCSESVIAWCWSFRNSDRNVIGLFSSFENKACFLSCHSRLHGIPVLFWRANQLQLWLLVEISFIRKGHFALGRFYLFLRYVRSKILCSIAQCRSLQVNIACREVDQNMCYWTSWTQFSIAWPSVFSRVAQHVTDVKLGVSV